jgi:hypothetical protein
MSIPELGYRLRKVDMNSALVNQYILHSIVSLDTVTFSLVFNECVLKGIPSLPVSNDLARLYRTKSAENELEIMILSDCIEFANEEHILRRLHISIW